MKLLNLIVYSLYQTITKNQRESGAYGTAVLIMAVFQVGLLMVLFTIMEILLVMSYVDYVSKMHVTIVLAIFWITNHAYFNWYVNKERLIAEFSHLEWKYIKRIAIGFLLSLFSFSIIIGILANYRDNIIPIN